jgi:hypothetical protein
MESFNNEQKNSIIEGLENETKGKTQMEGGRVMI